MRFLRLVLFGTLAAALALTGCAPDGDQPSSGTTGPGAVQTLGAGPEPTDEVCGTAEPATGPTSIVHASGTTQVPADPQRIVILDSDKLDSMCALGLQSRIVGTVELAGGLPSYLGTTIAQLTTVGPISEPALEKIAALKPDLILGSKFRTADLYTQLSQIAPTVFTELVGLTWKANFLLDGKAVRRGAQAETLLENYQAAAKELGGTVNGAAAEASITRFRPGGVRVYGPTSFSGQVLADAGISRPKFQLLEAEKDRRFAEISSEQLNLADGKVIYVAAYGPDADAERQQVMASPLWKTLSGVKAGRVYLVKDETWMTGIGVVAAGRILADLKESLG